MLLVRRSSTVVAVVAVVGAVTVLPALASPEPAGRTGPAGRAMCLDVTNERADNTRVRLWQCMDHPNQRFAGDRGHIKVKDTVGTGREMCLDATNLRADGTQVRLWKCMDHPNQIWVGVLVLS